MYYNILQLTVPLSWYFGLVFPVSRGNSSGMFRVKASQKHLFLADLMYLKDGHVSTLNKWTTGPYITYITKIRSACLKHLWGPTASIHPGSSRISGLDIIPCQSHHRWELWIQNCSWLHDLLKITYGAQWIEHDNGLLWLWMEVSLDILYYR